MNNQHFTKAKWWYENHPSGPIMEGLRYYRRDCPWISRLHNGTMDEWADFCRAAWGSTDQTVRTQAYYSIPAMLKVSHIVGREPKVSDEERRANVNAVNEAIKFMLEGKVKNISKGDCDEND